MACLAGWLALCATAGCLTFDGVDQADDQPLAQDVGTTPLCRWIEDRLAGQHGTVYPVRGSSRQVAITQDGILVCVDDMEAALGVGVIAVPPPKPAICKACDGTPLPAQVWNGLVRLVIVQ
jgi:hypothetical protein